MGINKKNMQNYQIITRKLTVLDVMLNNYFALNCVFILKKTEEKKTIHIVMFS